MITPAQSVNAFSAAAPPEKLARVPMKTLGQDEFLKLLVTQMRNQDPLKPVSDTEFIAQMAQFSNLEQTKQMSGDIAQLRAGNALAQGTALMGRHVRLAGDENTFTNGIVTDLEVKEGEVSLIVNNKAYELGQVVSVNSEEPTAEEAAEEPALGLRANLANTPRPPEGRPPLHPALVCGRASPPCQPPPKSEPRPQVRCRTPPRRPPPLRSRVSSIPQ
mgnify:CR=1 FL=1